MSGTQILEISEEEAATVLAMREKKEAAKILKPYGKFVVLVGEHEEGLDGKLHNKDTGPFLSSSNLTKRFGEDKFRLISLCEGVEVGETEDPNDYEPEDTLAAMTVDELKQFAAEQGLDIGRAKTRDAILKAIRTQTVEV